MGEVFDDHRRTYTHSDVFSSARACERSHEMADRPALYPGNEVVSRPRLYLSDPTSTLGFRSDCVVA
jgi:hypothetical protein